MRATIALFVFYCMIIVGILVGYIMNLVALVSLVTAGAPVNGLLLGRGAGLFFPPLGAILGYVL